MVSKNPPIVPMYRSSSAFTIVELLVAIVVIGILAAITIVSYTGITSRAVVSALQSDLTNASSQLKLYQIDHSAYPTSLNASNCPLDSSGVVDSTYCIKPTSGNTFLYSSNNNSNPQTFSLYAINTSTSTKYRTTNDSSPTVATPVVATGGTITNIGGYRIHTFTTSGTFTVTSGGDVEYLVVAGGGGGGIAESASTGDGAGGGGGGGLLTNVGGPVYIATSGTYSVVVGSGGAAATVGGNSSLFSVTAVGGGAGGGVRNAGNKDGGSGGGAGGNCDSLVMPGGAATLGQGNRGGNDLLNPPTCGARGGRGGGGAGSPGLDAISSNGTDAGNGRQSTISGSLLTYAGGGGGGRGGPSSVIGGFGGSGGGGNGGNGTVGATSGTPGTGGGGGGGNAPPASFLPPGNGGSGIVIIRYPN